MQNIDVTAPADTGWCAVKLHEYSSQGEQGKKMIKPILKRLIDTNAGHDAQPYLSFPYEIDGVTRQATHSSFEDFMRKWCKLSIDEVRDLFHKDDEVRALLDFAAKPDGRAEGNNKTGRNQHSVEDNLYNVQSNQEPANEAPTGNRKEAGMRKLKKHAPDAYQQVINGEKTINKALIEAGLREPTLTIKANPEGAAKTIAKHFTDEQIRDLINRLEMTLEALA